MLLLNICITRVKLECGKNKKIYILISLEIENVVKIKMVKIGDRVKKN